MARALSQSDRAYWADYARLVTPFAGRNVPELSPLPAMPPPIVAPVAPPPMVKRPAATSRPAWLTIGMQPAGLDNATWSRFRAGKIAPTRTLDLHGRTAQRAFHALEEFLHGAARDRLRCVEVITGRGSGAEGGVLRREFPLWLNLDAIRSLVLAATHPHAANLGAVRLLMRRARQ